MNETDALVFCKSKTFQTWFDLMAQVATPVARSQCFIMGCTLQDGRNPSIAGGCRMALILS